MDSLAALPKRETPLSRDEEETMKNLFPEDTPRRAPPPRSNNEATENDGSESTTKTNWKLIGYTTLLFLILVIPFIDKIVCRLPYCGENAIALMVFKTLIFAVAFFFIVKYAA